MPLPQHTPVIVGTGQVSHHTSGLDDAMTPAELMAEAIRRAATDAGLASLPDVDSIRVVSTLSWRAADPARHLADLLGIRTSETGLSTAGGNSPQSLVNATALEIQAGGPGIVVLTGARHGARANGLARRASTCRGRTRRRARRARTASSVASWT